jgi:hypothetical protein
LKKFLTVSMRANLPPQRGTTPQIFLDRDDSQPRWLQLLHQDLRGVGLCRRPPRWMLKQVIGRSISGAMGSIPREILLQFFFFCHAGDSLAGDPAHIQKPEVPRTETRGLMALQLHCAGQWLDIVNDRSAIDLNLRFVSSEIMDIVYR